MYKKITLLCFLLIIIIRIIDIKFIKYSSLYDQYIIKSNNKVLGSTPPRGKILDTNGNIIVDNKTINNIYYRKISNNNEYEIASYLTNILKLDDMADSNMLKKYYMDNNDTNYLLTNEEINDYKYRRLSYDDIYKIKMDRLNDEINKYNNYDKKVIYTYYLMQKGYKADTKLIKSNVSDEECASIIEKDIDGLTCEFGWVRVNHYPYLNSIMGTVGLIPYDGEQEYINNGYNKDDLVGLSGLEKYYDTYLKGEKAIYEINNDNTLNLIQEEKKGNNLVLSLDMNINDKAFRILEDNLKLAKKFSNTSFYNHAYIIVGNPNTGEILAIAGLRLEDDSFKEISIDAINSSYTVGSIVKGASHTVGYLNNVIDIDQKILDSCVKLYFLPSKCSFKRLGFLDDISALKMSSNYYQFITAIKLTGNKYVNNMKLDVTEDDFNKYRDIFKLYGLGSSTGIDFPKESLGLKGNTIAPDLYLNLAIGQYDNYTPLQLLSYINTIANNGNRLSLSFKKQNNNIIDTIPLEDSYMKRIQKGFYEVVNNGTGRGYTDYKYKAAGKTGTSESFFNKDVITINQSYVMYAPFDNPKYSMVVVNPNISYNNSKNNYIAPTNRLISKEMSNYLMNY